MQIRLKGKTQHGKNRVRQHGEWWEVTSVSVSRKMMWLESLDHTFRVKPFLMAKDSRSISLENDENFEIIEISSPEPLRDEITQEESYPLLRKLLGI